MGHPSVVKQEEGEPEVPAEVIAQSIKKIADAVDKMNASGLTRRAIVVLLRGACGESTSTIENVLDGLNDLKSLYLIEKAGK